MEATLLAAHGRAAEATALLRRTGADAVPEGLLADGWARLQDEPVSALRDARRLAEQAALPLDVRIEANVLAAAAQLESSRQDAARASLDSALALAEPELIRRPFDEMPPRLRALLRGLPDVQEGGMWARTPAHGRVRPPAVRRRGTCAAVTQPLTDREREVLTHLAALLPTEEIASQMFLSVNTVKTHVRAILRKLSAERRNDAVRRARELGLV